MAKRKILMYSLFGLVAVSLTSVAFANWIISGTEAATSSNNVTVQVGEVVDQRLTATANVTEGKVCFDAIKTDTTGPITYGGTTSGEDLSFAISVTVTNAVTSTNTVQSYFTGIKLNWTLANDVPSNALKDAIETNYIISPLSTTEVTLSPAVSGTNTIDGKEISADWSTLGTSLKADITFKFKWNTTTKDHGVTTAGDNPCLVSSTATSTQVSNCVTMLNALYSANGAKFTVTATPVSSNS